MLRKCKRKTNPLKPDTRSKAKKGPLRDPEHLERVRGLLCWLCQRTPCEAHHIRECFPRTMGVRVGDDRVIPLCSGCHRDVHAKSRRFWLLPEIPRNQAALLYAETLSLRGEAHPSSNPRSQP